MQRFRKFVTCLALTLGLIAFTSTAMAHGNGNGNGKNGGSVPELDATTIGSGLALLGFGATMLINRGRRK
jgi:hypothetical protein